MGLLTADSVPLLFHNSIMQSHNHTLESPLCDPSWLLTRPSRRDITRDSWWVCCEGKTEYRPPGTSGPLLRELRSIDKPGDSLCLQIWQVTQYKSDQWLRLAAKMATPCLLCVRCILRAGRSKIELKLRMILWYYQWRWKSFWTHYENACRPDWAVKMMRQLARGESDDNSN